MLIINSKQLAVCFSTNENHASQTYDIILKIIINKLMMMEVWISSHSINLLFLMSSFSEAWV